MNASRGSSSESESSFLLALAEVPGDPGAGWYGRASLKTVDIVDLVKAEVKALEI